MIRHKLTILTLLVIFAVILHIILNKTIESSARKDSRLQLDFVKECVLKDPLVNDPSKFTWDNLSDRLNTCASDLKITNNSGISVITLNNMNLFWDSSTYCKHSRPNKCISGDITLKESYDGCDRHMYMIHQGYNGSSSTFINNKNFWIEWEILPTSSTTFSNNSRNEVLLDNNVSDLNQIAVIFRISSEEYLNRYVFLKYLGFAFLIIYIIYSVFVIYSADFNRRSNDKV